MRWHCSNIRVLCNIDHDRYWAETAFIAVVRSGFSVSENPPFETCVGVVGCVSFVVQVLVTAVPRDASPGNLSKEAAGYERGLLTGRTML